MNTKEVHFIREWAPMSDIMEGIPTRVNRGFFPVDLGVTCIDAVSEFLVLGSDAGIVFWCSRHRAQIQKLNLDTATRITCVKVVNSVEYMVAAGNASGQVWVFQIQKELPADLNLVAPCARAKPIERYIIRDLHHDAITCCEWSKNGMKLYSGDRQGVVVLTELDYQNHVSKSAEILSEAYEIVQLSVHQSYLLVSTIYRSIICQREDTSFGSWKITQVGKKDRKQLFDCGGIFLKGETTKLPKLLCGRPGLRFWLSDIKGNVEKTLLFRDAVACSASWEIPILNPKASQKTTSANEGENCVTKNFRRLHLYDSSHSSLVVTHDDEAKLYVLNLTYLRVEAVATGFRKILDMCVCGNELFILEGDRSLLRLAPMPDKPNKKAKIIFNPSMPPPLPFLSSTSSSFIYESPAEYKLEEESAVINADECFELPRIEEINFNISIELAVESPRSEQSRRLEIFQQISDLDFDHTILHHSGISTSARTRRSNVKSRKHIKSEGIIEIGRSAIRGPKAQLENLEIATNQAIMEYSLCTEPINKSHKTTFSDLLPNPLSAGRLTKTIEINTKELTEELDIPSLDLEPITTEELTRSQDLAAAPNWQLPLIYPGQHSVQLEDAGVQTTPCKKMYFLTDECDFGNGEPIDGICETLPSATLKEDKGDASPSVSKSKIPQQGVVKFVSSKAVDEEINSFLLNFNLARDPMSTSPQASGKSNTSSEWEFLQN